MPQYKFKRDPANLVSVEEAGRMIKSAKHDWLKALISFLYLFGCRISEALEVRRGDFWIENNYLAVRMKILKKRKKKKSSGPYGDGDFHILRVSLDAPFVKKILIPYLKKIKNRESRVFPVSRQLAWRKMKDLNPNISPHIFRHDRLLKFALKGATGVELMDWAGWSDMRPARNYLLKAGRLAANLADKVD